MDEDFEKKNVGDILHLTLGVLIRYRSKNLVGPVRQEYRKRQGHETDHGHGTDANMNIGIEMKH
jgi:hypothetical protein